MNKFYKMGLLKKHLKPEGMRTKRVPIKGLSLQVACAVCLGFGVLLSSAHASDETKSDAQSWNDSLTPVLRNVPEFSLQGLDGTEWSTQALKGKPWIINFWAGWCPPCIEELPSLNNTWSQVEGKGVGMLAINIGESADKITEFLGRAAIDFPVVLGDPRKTLANWSARGLPTTVILNSHGQVVYEAVGPRDWDAPSIIDAVLALLDN